MSSEVETSLDSLKTARDSSTSLGMTTARPSRLFHRISWHDFEALDHHAFGRFARLAHAIFGHRNLTNFLQHILAFNQFAKGRVLMVEPVHRREADEELRTGGVRIRPAR